MLASPASAAAGTFAPQPRQALPIPSKSPHSAPQQPLPTTCPMLRSSSIMHTETHDKQSLDYILKSMVAGGIAGSAAKTVIAPLDRVKILFQTSNPHYEHYAGSLRGAVRAMREIIQNHGYPALFQGHSATLLRIFPYAAVKFMAYEQYKTILMPNGAEKSPLKGMIAGSMAGVTSVFVSYPLDLVRVRLAFQSQRTPFLSIVRTVYNEPNPWFGTNTSRRRRPVRLIAGIGNFYRGFVPTVYGMIPYAGVSFYTYESLKTWCMDSLIAPAAVVNWREVNEANDNGSHVKPQLRAWAYLTSGALSGMLAQASSYPMEVIRRNMQVSAVRHAGIMSKVLSTNGSINRGRAGINPTQGLALMTRTTYETAKWIYARKGVPGFFVGLSIGFVKVVPMFAVSFYMYEWMKQVLDIDWEG
ncbi:hypothetical protein SeMB42_g02085 [Synchytrium endobioticum]|uniref:Uncharacterized protein n=1 Tax=Synchytrium endobioticum TaxID=286115 RepID=A0A507CEV9_9FUNG|nr:hypothetical protein SeLEV6574_g06823 [Synchytrium endobioticum]TPX50887.1 hypothetical protein SeMB42_g02085 [Synchytrium endobioticum]